MISEAYKKRVLTWIAEHPDGVPTCDLKVKFPRAPIREMEKEDGTIAYENDRWIITSEDYQEMFR